MLMVKTCSGKNAREKEETTVEVNVHQQRDKARERNRGEAHRIINVNVRRGCLQPIASSATEPNL